MIKVCRNVSTHREYIAQVLASDRHPFHVKAIPIESHNVTARNSFYRNPQYILFKYQQATGIHFTSKQFRSNLITLRQEMGISPYDSERLMNHAPSNLEFKHYMKKNGTRLRKLYDKYNPYD